MAYHVAGGNTQIIHRSTTEGATLFIETENYPVTVSTARVEYASEGAMMRPGDRYIISIPPGDDLFAHGEGAPSQESTISVSHLGGADLGTGDDWTVRPVSRSSIGIRDSDGRPINPLSGRHFNREIVGSDSLPLEYEQQMFDNDAITPNISNEFEIAINTSGAIDLRIDVSDLPWDDPGDVFVYDRSSFSQATSTVIQLDTTFRNIRAVAESGGGNTDTVQIRRSGV